MTRTVRELLAVDGPSFSFEFFPPKTDEGAQRLWQAIRELEPLEPTFVSVTYGAGGSTRGRTLAIVSRIARETDLVPVAHLTCVAATVAELRDVASQLASAGIVNILALRGDAPDGPRARWVAADQGLDHADALVRLLHETGDFCIGVAAFPEGHPESPDLETDVCHFVRKCAAGADYAITQFFFDSSHYFAMVDRVRAAGCETPIIPGVMPVTNVRQIQRFAELSGAEFPPDLAQRLMAVEHDPDKVRAIGVEVALRLCQELLAGGAPGIHFYTLNRSTATREIFSELQSTRVR